MRRAREIRTCESAQAGAMRELGAQAQRGGGPAVNAGQLGAGEGSAATGVGAVGEAACRGVA